MNVRSFVSRALAALTAAAALAAGAKDAPTRLDVTAQPEGAQVSIDGAARGTAPVSLFDVAPGRHLVHVEAPGSRAVDAFVTVAEGEYAQKNYALEPEFGLLLVKTEPAGADVQQAGVSLGRTPLLVTTLRTDATYQLELSKNGYRAKRVDVVLAGRTPVVREETLTLDSGTLECSSEPAGATVLVNGVEKGVTPCTVEAVPKGDALITFKLEGYDDGVFPRHLSAGERQQVFARLKGRPARLRVVTVPERANVSVDDSYQGKSPVTVSPIAPGTRRLTVKLPGYETVEKEVTLANGADVTEEIALASVMGRLEIMTQPAGVRVMLDGHTAGVTKEVAGSARSEILAVEGVEAGEHRLVLKLNGYREVARTVQVKAKATVPVKAALVKLFVPNVEVETTRGVYRGVLVSNDYDGLKIETSPGVVQTFPQADVRSTKTIR